MKGIDQSIGTLELTKSKSSMVAVGANSSIRKYSAGIMLAASGSNGFDHENCN